MKKDYVAEDFTLKSVDGKMTSLYEFLSGKDHHGFLIAFICNHCPYVKAILEKLTVDIKKLSVLNIPTIAICSNDDVLYPEDSFENMQKMSKANMFDFPYLHDRNQKVAQKYGAVCTPDFLGLMQIKPYNTEVGSTVVEKALVFQPTVICIMLWWKYQETVRMLVNNILL